jgi:hypothetical protein
MNWHGRPLGYCYIYQKANVNRSMQQLGVPILPTWSCNNKNRLAGGSDDWHEGKVGIPSSLWEGLTLSCQSSFSCGFPSSVQEVLWLDIRLDSLCSNRHAYQGNRGYNQGQKSAKTWNHVLGTVSENCRWMLTQCWCNLCHLQL